MPELILIGTDHYDRKGRSRLELALEKEAPDIVTVETSPAFLSLFIPRRGLGSVYDSVFSTLIKRMKKVGYERTEITEAEAFFRDIHLYELKVAVRYAQRKNIRCEAIDDPVQHDIAAEGLPALKFSQTNAGYYLEDLKQSGRLLSQEKIEEYYRLYTNLFSETIAKQTEQVEKERIDNWGYNPQRDHFPAKRLHEFMKLDGIKKIISITGVTHLLDDEKQYTLYSIIRDDLHPVRRTLASYA